jgi:hypothetical protein
MHKIYSPKGARRGILIAVITAGIWSAWAIGFSQGIESPQQKISLISINK